MLGFGSDKELPKGATDEVDERSFRAGAVCTSKEFVEWPREKNDHRARREREHMEKEAADSK